MGNAIDTILVGLGEGEWKKVKFVDQGQIMTFRYKESDKYFRISQTIKAQIVWNLCTFFILYQ